MNKKYFVFDEKDASPHDETFEESLIKEFCRENENYGIKYSRKLPDDMSNIIPVGSVEWCEHKYKNIIPKYYPSFLQKYFRRNIWKTTYKELLSKKLPDNGLFIKPATKYKKWNGFILKMENMNEQQIEDDEEIYCSEVINIINEWRYYILNGEIIGAAWYDGNISDEDVLNGLAKPPPQLPDDLLTKIKNENYSGVLDMGETFVDENILVLIEACHPYAIGWYLGKNTHNELCKFLIEGHKQLSS